MPYFGYFTLLNMPGILLKLLGISELICNDFLKYNVKVQLRMNQK